MRKYQPHKDTPPNPLYIITYSVGATAVKCMTFQTEKQFDSWRNSSYALAKEYYTITIEKRPKGNFVIWQEYSKVDLDD